MYEVLRGVTLPLSDSGRGCSLSSRHNRNDPYFPAAMRQAVPSCDSPPRVLSYLHFSLNCSLSLFLSRDLSRAQIHLSCRRRRRRRRENVYRVFVLSSPSLSRHDSPTSRRLYISLPVKFSVEYGSPFLSHPLSSLPLSPIERRIDSRKCRRRSERQSKRCSKYWPSIFYPF